MQNFEHGRPVCAIITLSDPIRLVFPCTYCIDLTVTGLSSVIHIILVCIGDQAPVFEGVTTDEHDIKARDGARLEDIQR